MLRVVLDTNVLVSAIISNGKSKVNCKSDANASKILESKPIEGMETALDCFYDCAIMVI